MWIADYQITAATNAATTYDSLTITLKDNTVFDVIGENTENRIKSLYYYSTQLANETVSTQGINYWKIYDDTEKYRNNLIGLSLGTTKTSSDSIVLFEPLGSSKSMLGTKNKPWSRLFAKEGVHCYESFQAFNEDTGKCDGVDMTGWHFIATQEWVTGIVIPLLHKRMREINAYYWWKTKDLTSALVNLSGVTKVTFSEGQAATTIIATSYSISVGDDGKIEVKPGGEATRTTVVSPEFLKGELDKLQDQIDKINTWVDAYKTHKHNFSSKSLAGTSSHSHSISEGATSTGSSSTGLYLISTGDTTGGPV